MKKYLLGLVLALVAASSFAWTQRPVNPPQACQAHAPYGFPQTAKQLQPICRQAYLVGYDAAAKLPNYVMYELLPPNALG